MNLPFPDYWEDGVCVNGRGTGCMCADPFDNECISIDVAKTCMTAHFPAVAQFRRSHGGGDPA